MDLVYISSDEEEVYTRQKADEEEITDIRDLRSDLDRFQQEDIVKDALKNDVDLSVYGMQIDRELNQYSNISIRDYIKNSTNIARLHLEVEKCALIISEMDKVLVAYQTDLDKAVNEIYSLQKESEIISMRLKNRKDVDIEIREIVSQLTIQPTTVNTLISGDMNQQFFTELAEFSRRLCFVDCIDVSDAVMLRRSMVKAIEEVKVDFNILRLHCGNRIRDSLYRKFGEIKKNSNIQMYQKEVLLKLSAGVQFLQKHLPLYYEEVCCRYSTIMKGIVYQIFHEYCTSLQTRLYDIGCVDDSIVMTKSKPSILKKRTHVDTMSPDAVFTLSDRHTVVDFSNSPPLLPQILITEGRIITYPELFRSAERHLLDCSLAEFEFEVMFFEPVDTSMFIDIYGPACEEVALLKEYDMQIHQMTVQWVRSSYDVVGLMLLCILLQGAVEDLAKDGVPILQEFFLKCTQLSAVTRSLRAKTMSRFRELMSMHIKSVKAVPIQPRNLDVTTDVHSSIRRYAELSCSIYVMGFSYNMLVGPELWEESISALSLEMVNLLMKLASCVKENKRPSFILNSCLYVADVYSSRHVNVENDFTKLYQDRLHLYIEEMMAKHFAPLVGIVDKYSDRGSGTITFSNVEIKGIQKYNSGWREGIRTVHERIRLDFKYKAVEVFKNFANEVSAYHAKYLQLMQGTPYSKDAAPVQTVVNEITKYRSDYDHAGSPFARNEEL